MTKVTKNQPETQVRLKPYKGSELALMYGVSHRTLKRWIAPFKKELGEKRGIYYNIPQVKMVFEKLGVPIGLGKKALEKEKSIKLNLNFLIDGSYQFAKTVLWPEIQLNSDEESITKKYIESYFKSCETSNIELRFISLCERVMLAKSYVERRAGRFIPHPLLWFNPVYAKGFSGTLNWYKQLEAYRTQFPNSFHKHRLLSEVYFNYLKNPELEMLLHSMALLNATKNDEVIEIFLKATSDLTSLFLKELSQLRYGGLSA